MISKQWTYRLSMVVAVLLVAACHDAPTPTSPPSEPDLGRGAQTTPPQQVAQWFARSSPEVLALPGTVFADHDESANRLVFGVEHAAVTPGIEAALEGLGVPARAYTVEVTEPIHFLSETLRSTHRPTTGGLQIHFDLYLCTLGFNVDHAGGRSFITNSHCTDKQGENSGTVYYQPTSSVDSNPIGVEADDPAYFRGGPCPRGRRCRYSDAARVLYENGVESLGAIAKTTGENNGSIETDGTFDVKSVYDSQASFTNGETLHKVGRTTGWTSGGVTNSCATVNVAGSNITLLCQTLVENDRQIAGAGDSGSPVFRTNGGDAAELVGILWGGSSNGHRFVFSPLKNVQDELGGFNATTDGVGDGGGGSGDAENGDDDNGSCPPGHRRQGRC